MSEKNNMSQNKQPDTFDYKYWMKKSLDTWESKLDTLKTKLQKEGKIELIDKNRKNESMDLFDCVSELNSID